MFSADSVTSATRIMLPAYVLLFLWIGTAYIATPQEQLKATPALNYADGLADLRVWGALFMVCAGLIVWAIVLEVRGVSRYALLLGVLSMAVFAGTFVWAAVRGEAAPSAGAWPALTSVALFASYRSITREESSPSRTFGRKG
jgi:hypothetical protein